MEENSNSSMDSGPCSPQGPQQNAPFGAENAAVFELQKMVFDLGKKLEEQQKQLQDAKSEIENLKSQLCHVKRENDVLRDEGSKKSAELADANDEIRKLRANSNSLGTVPRKNNYRSESESDALYDDFDLESRRNRKRKGKSIPGKGNKSKKADLDNGLEDMELEVAQGPSSRYDANFPALGKGSNEIQEGRRQESKKTAPTSESVAPGQKQASQVSSNVNVNVNDNVKFQRNARGNNLRPRQTKVPPVILREKSRYNEVTAGFKARKINFVQATTLPEGVKIVPSTSDDFRAMTRYLDDIKAEYHSYQLSEDKLLHVILRGVLESFTEEEIEADLKAQGFSPKKVLRWKYKDGNPMPMVLVMVPKEDKNIFNVTNIKQNSVKVESQRVKSRITQCFNCQMFGHSSFGCRAKPKCVRCSEEHRSKDCKKPVTRDTAKCANCAGNHPASFGGCPKHPKYLVNQQKKVPQRKEFKWGTQDNAKIAANPENMGAAMNSINQMNAAMQQFFKNLQQMQQQFASTFMSGPSTSKA